MSRTGTFLVLVGAFSALRPVHLAAQSAEEPADDVLAGDVLGDVADGDDETGDGEAGDHEAGEEAVGEARAHFRKGVDYYGDGDFASSLLEFERAYKLQPTYRLLFNMGQVAYEQRDYIAAEGYFSKYLVQGGDRIDRERRDAVEADLRRLRGRIGRMRVRVDRAGARVFIDGKPVGRSPFRAPVRASAGRRSVRAELAGFASVDRSVEVVGGEEVEVSFELGVPLTQSSAPVVEENPYRGGSSSVAPWVAGIGAGALAVGGGVLGYLAYADQRDYEGALARNTSRAELNALSDAARQKALAADILLGAALVAGVVTVILALTGDDGESPAPRMAAQLGGRPIGHPGGWAPGGTARF